MLAPPECTLDQFSIFQSKFGLQYGVLGKICKHVSFIPNDSKHRVVSQLGDSNRGHVAIYERAVVARQQDVWYSLSPLKSFIDFKLGIVL